MRRAIRRQGRWIGDRVGEFRSGQDRHRHAALGTQRQPANRIELESSLLPHRQEIPASARDPPPSRGRLGQAWRVGRDEIAQ